MIKSSQVKLSASSLLFSMPERKHPSQWENWQRMSIPYRNTRSQYGSWQHHKSQHLQCILANTPSTYLLLSTSLLNIALEQGIATRTLSALHTISSVRHGVPLGMAFSHVVQGAKWHADGRRDVMSGRSLGPSQKWRVDEREKGVAVKTARASQKCRYSERQLRQLKPNVADPSHDWQMTPELVWQTTWRMCPDAGGARKKFFQKGGCYSRRHRRV